MMSGCDCCPKMGMDNLDSVNDVNVYKQRCSCLEHKEEYKQEQ